MNRKAVILVPTVLFLLGCGVRGRPEPPLTPAELGRGRPTYKRATEDFAMPNPPPVQTSEEGESTDPATSR